MRLWNVSKTTEILTQYAIYKNLEAMQNHNSQVQENHAYSVTYKICMVLLTCLSYMTINNF